MLLRKVLTAAAILLVPSLHAQSVFIVSSQWDVRPGGADPNGGAFDPTVVAPGTDESQSNTGTSISCVVQTTTTQAICTPALTSTTHGPGNYIKFASGSGCNLTPHYDLLSQSSGTGTFNASLGTAASVCVGVIGGSMQTIQGADTARAADDVVNIKSGTTYTWTALYTLSSGGSWVGYQTTHGDNGAKAVIQATTSVTSGAFVQANTTAGTYLFQNLDFEDTTGTNIAVLKNTSSSAVTFVVISNCKINGFDAAADYDSAGTPLYLFVTSTEISNTSLAVLTGGGVIATTLSYDYFHGNGRDFLVGLGGQHTAIEYSIFSGTTSGPCGTCFGNSSIFIDHNVWYNASQNMIDIIQTGSSAGYALITNNVFYGNTSGGPIEHNAINPGATNVSMFNNAFGNTFTPNQSPYLNPTNIALTADPFVNGSAGNFALNGTAGGGALLKAHAFPASYGSTTTSTGDINAPQAVGGVTVSGGNYGQSN